MFENEFNASELNAQPLGNPIQNYEGIANLVNSVNSNKMFQARALSNQYQEKSIGPDGSVNQQQLNSFLMNDPRTAPYAGDILQNAQQYTNSGLTNVGTQTANLRNDAAIAAAAAKAGNPNVTPDDLNTAVNRALISGVNGGRYPQALVTSILGNGGQTPDGNNIYNSSSPTPSPSGLTVGGKSAIPLDAVSPNSNQPSSTLTSGGTNKGAPPLPFSSPSPISGGTTSPNGSTTLSPITVTSAVPHITLPSNPGAAGAALGGLGPEVIQRSLVGTPVSINTGNTIQGGNQSITGAITPTGQGVPLSPQPDARVPYVDSQGVAHSVPASVVVGPGGVAIPNVPGITGPHGETTGNLGVETVNNEGQSGYNSPGGFIPTGKSPAQTGGYAAATAIGSGTGSSTVDYSNALTKEADAAKQASANMSELTKIINNPTFSPGPLNAEFAFTAALAAQLGIAPPANKTQAALAETATKLESVMVGGALQSYGAGASDARQQLSIASNIHNDLSRLGQQSIVPTLAGMQDAVLAKQAAWNAYHNQYPTVASTTFDNLWNQKVDPRVFIANRMPNNVTITGGTLAQGGKSLKAEYQSGITGADLKQYQASQKYLQSIGLIP